MRTYADILGIDIDYHDALKRDHTTGLSAWAVPDMDYAFVEEDDIGPDDEVYGIVILDDAGEHIDSCWGYVECFSLNDPNSYVRMETERMLADAVSAYVTSGGWVTI